MLALPFPCTGEGLKHPRQFCSVGIASAAQVEVKPDNDGADGIDPAQKELDKRTARQRCEVGRELNYYCSRDAGVAKEVQTLLE